MNGSISAILESTAQFTCNRMWLQLMLQAGCTKERKPKPSIKRPADIRQKHKAIIMPYYFRHNFVTMRYESGIDPLIAVRLVGHSDYQTNASIYTHLKDKLLKKAASNIDGVFSPSSGNVVPNAPKLGAYCGKTGRQGVAIG